MLMRVVIERDKVPLGDTGPLSSGDQHAAAAREKRRRQREGAKEACVCVCVCSQEWLLIGSWGFNNRTLIRVGEKARAGLMSNA